MSFPPRHLLNDPRSILSLDGRKVYLPLSRIVSCTLCQKPAAEAKLRQCIACGEVLYCSTECQQRDWKNHKVQCGETDRIDLGSFYPLLASIALIAHVHPDVIKHPALDRQIMKPEFPVVNLPNGIAARLVLLGDRVPTADMGHTGWWPTAPSEQVRNKMFRRIVNEGFLLPNLLSICIAMVSEIYTTTALPPDDDKMIWQITENRRVRLTYNHSPIADFGIVQGSMRVEAGDRLAYLTMDGELFHMGQNPDEHYRIYIKTLAGDEYYLDFGAYTFNFFTVVNAGPYCKHGLPDLNVIPAFFMGRSYDKVKIDMFLFTPRKRFSVLRDPRVHEMVRRWDLDSYSRHEKNIFAMMDEIAGKECNPDEKKMMMAFLPNAVHLIRLNMKEREYRNFPEKPQTGIDTYPGERGNITQVGREKKEEVYNYFAKQARKMKKGKISQARWEKTFHDWAEKNVKSLTLGVGSGAGPSAGPGAPQPGAAPQTGAGQAGAGSQAGASSQAGAGPGPRSQKRQGRK